MGEREVKVKLTGKADDKGVPYVKVIGKRKSDEELRKVIEALGSCNKHERCDECPAEIVCGNSTLDGIDIETILKWVLGE